MRLKEIFVLLAMLAGCAPMVSAEDAKPEPTPTVALLTVDHITGQRELLEGQLETAQQRLRQTQVTVERISGAIIALRALEAQAVATPDAQLSDTEADDANERQRLQDELDEVNKELRRVNDELTVRKLPPETTTAPAGKNGEVTTDGR